MLLGPETGELSGAEYYLVRQRFALASTKLQSSASSLADLQVMSTYNYIYIREYQPNAYTGGISVYRLVRRRECQAGM